MGDTTAEQPQQLDHDKSKFSNILDNQQKVSESKLQDVELPELASETVRKPEESKREQSIAQKSSLLTKTAQYKNTPQLSSRSLMIRQRVSIDYTNNMPEGFKSGFRNRTDSIKSYKSLKKSFTKEVSELGPKGYSTPASKQNQAQKASAFSFAHLKQQKPDAISQRINDTVRSTTPKADKTPEMLAKTPSRRRIYLPANRGSDPQIAQSRENSVSRLLYDRRAK